MSIGFLPVFQPALLNDPFAAVPGGMCAIVQDIDALNGAAIERDLTMLTDFADNRAAPDDFDGDAAALDEIMGAWNEWFEPGDALRTVAALREELGVNFEAMGVEAGRVAELRRELGLFESALKQGVAAKSLFRLEVVR